MFFAHTDARPMTPAARAFFVLRFGHRSARFFRLMDPQITQDEKFFQLFLVDHFRDIGVRMQNNRRLERLPD